MLPIDDVLNRVRAAVTDAGRLVLQAPPGAGKTTRVPLALLKTVRGRIVMLEPRRLAARAAAERMAETLGEAVGQTVGYRIRGEAKTCSATRIEVVTEGILTRMIQSDPSLEGTGAVIFDEFHERSLNADLGLALVWEARQALRPDLVVVVMSATLDAGPVATLLDGAPIVTSEGRAFPVAPRWLDRPTPKGQRFETAVAGLIKRAAQAEDGGILAFLPGEGEIRRVAAALDLPGCDIRPLYGALPFAAQRSAIRPGPRRKVVLATAIAETSLTIEDVRVVVDGGLARRARFDPGSGMARLVTEKVSRAEAAQRAGRAGRVAPGAAWKLWTKGAEGALPAFAPPEIDVADLAPLALELSVWGARDPAALPFLTMPPEGPLSEARALLRDLGAIDRNGAVTSHGSELARMPLHPRLAHMLARGGADAAPLAALLSAGERTAQGGVDLRARLRHPGPQAAAEAKRLRRWAGRRGNLGPAQAAALAYPDRVGLRRQGDAPRWLLSGGKGAAMPPDDPLAAARLLVVTDTDGDPREARIRAALEISEAELREVLGDRIAWTETCAWSDREGRVVARRQERLGAIALDDRVWHDVPDHVRSAAMLEGVRRLGLSPGREAARLLSRVAAGRRAGLSLFDPAPDALLDEAEVWLLPFLGEVSDADGWKRFDLLPALEARLTFDARAELDRVAPATLRTPLGRHIPISYAGETPEAEVRVQEMFGQPTHPVVAGRPVRLHLLSPAGRPIQVTMDLPGFWAGEWAEVRKEMRGRYPKHPWPENPAEAAPTLRARPRG